MLRTSSALRLYNAPEWVQMSIAYRRLSQGDESREGAERREGAKGRGVAVPLTEMKESLFRIPPPSCGLLIILHSPDRPLNTAICGGAEYLCGIIAQFLTMRVGVKSDDDRVSALLCKGLPA